MGSLVETYGWHEWICHTNFSFLIGASHPWEYIERALAFRYHSLAVTDYDGVYGLARAHRDLSRRLSPLFEGEDVRGPASPAAGERGNGLRSESGEEGDVRAPAPSSTLRLVHGMELRLAPHHDRPLVLQDTLVLIARSHLGYRNLCRLSTYAHRNGKTDALVTIEELLSQPVEGLTAIQPMRGVLRHGLPAAELVKRFGKLREHFGGELYFAVSRHLNPAEDCWIPGTVALARKLGAPLLLSQDAFFHAPSRKEMSDLLQAIRTNSTLDEAVHLMFPNCERSLHSLKGIEQRFGSLSFYEEALRESRDLAERCAFSMDELRYRYPKEMIPEGLTPQQYLEKLVWQGAAERYGESVPGRITALLHKELRLIDQLGFADYFLTVWDIVRWARSQGILCQGRGSAANSAVCFVLGVTSVDPSLFDLVFERFISVERGDPPDIDVDFEHERREEVIQYIYERYGRDRAAMVANVITYRSKGAMRAVGKALGVSEEILNSVSKSLESRYFRRTGTQEVLAKVRQDLALDVGYATSRDLKVDSKAPEEREGATAISTPDDVPWDLWYELAEKLRGFPRHLGIHSGGFMLADQSLDWLCAQEPATMEGRTVVQWCKDDIEGLGFFKIDVLALGMLTAVRKCFQSLEKHYGVEMSMATVPQEDPATYAMLQRADTVGTFQVESRAQMSMLPRLRPRTFYDLVIEVAIIRPGPIQGGMIHPFLRRRNGQEPVSFPDDRLRPILARTLGVPIFQEQVMRIAMAVGGFTPGEANELRRHMGAWSLKGDLTPMLRKLAKGMRANGLSDEFIKSIISQMKGFADYGFPESHAVSFALIAYVSCYLKCHYPAAFFAAVLNSQPMGFYSPHALLQAAVRDGVTILPVCVNKSEWDCTLERVSDEGEKPVFGIRLGLRMVNSLREAGARELLSARARVGGAWADAEHFLQTVRLYRNDLTALAAANALQALGLDRRSAIWIVEAAPFCPVLEDEEDPVEFEPETSLERIEQDFASTSTTLGPHPSRVIRDEHWCFEVPVSRLTSAKELERVANGRMVDVFGMVLVRQSPPSAGGMVFLTLEDETGFFNLVFTPPVYARFYELIERQAFLCIRGRVQRNNESRSLLVQNVYEPRYERATVIKIPPIEAGSTLATRVEKHLGESADMGQQAARERFHILERPLSKARNYH